MRTLIAISIALAAGAACREPSVSGPLAAPSASAEAGAAAPAPAEQSRALPRSSASGPVAADAAVDASTCPGARIGLDESTPMGFSPRQALRVLHADEQRLWLFEDRLGFFESVGLGEVAGGNDEVTFRFRPSSPYATYFDACAQQHRPPRLLVPGSVSAQLSRGATFTASGPLEILGSDGHPSRGSFNANATPPGHRVQLVWGLGPLDADRRPPGATVHSAESDPRPPSAILHSGESDSFWRIRQAADAGGGPAGSSEIAQAFAAFSGRPMRCGATWEPKPDFERQPSEPEPPSHDPAPPAPYSSAAPAISVVAIGERSVGGVDQGSAVVRMSWPGDVRPLEFSLPLHRAGPTRTPMGYVGGWGARNVALPAPMAAWAGCTELGRSTIHLEAIADERGKLAPATGSYSWGPGCNRLVSCSFSDRRFCVRFARRATCSVLEQLQVLPVAFLLQCLHGDEPQRCGVHAIA